MVHEIRAGVRRCGGGDKQTESLVFLVLEIGRWPGEVTVRFAFSTVRWNMVGTPKSDSTHTVQRSLS